MYSTQTTVSLAINTSAPLIPAAANRVALLVQAPTGTKFTMSMLSTAVPDQGITLYPSGQTLMLNLRDHGDIVTRAWSAISSVAQSVTFISVFDK